ncbi:TetR/AcrR family transcriptional regulator [Paenibacillus elgii]|uniref:TetR/AcrR family transcriptional regulator n=1 Tax=Paenibacillus elgii TaxID=189691 RepID=UPI000FDA18D3|nr:TetR/AcrR family transcriptional regulator [Paenibacillus elgii]NEN87212.1 TetR/AcrR family transcriptional regulator [Paenibacillus elgii]
MNPKVQDKRMEKGEQTRIRILHAAIAIISEHGIKEVSAAKLAQLTGVSKSNIFHHFKSIDEILHGALHILFDDLLEPMAQEYRDLEQFLHQLGQSIFRVPEPYLKAFKAFFSFYHEGMFNADFREALLSCTDKITELLGHQLNRLALRPLDEKTLESVTALLFSLMDGMGLHYLLNGNGQLYEQAWRLQVSMLCRHLAEDDSLA